MLLTVNFADSVIHRMKKFISAKVIIEVSAVRLSWKLSRRLPMLHSLIRCWLAWGVCDDLFTKEKRRQYSLPLT